MNLFQHFSNQNSFLLQRLFLSNNKNKMRILLKHILHQILKLHQRLIRRSYKINNKSNSLNHFNQNFWKILFKDSFNKKKNKLNFSKHRSQRLKKLQRWLITQEKKKKISLLNHLSNLSFWILHKLFKSNLNKMRSQLSQKKHFIPYFWSLLR